MSTRIQRLREKSDPKLASALEALIRKVVDGLDQGKNCDHLVAEINALSGQDFKPDFFFELYAWTSEKEAAKLAAKGMPPAWPDLTRDELLEVIRVISEGGEPDCSLFLSLLDRSFPGAWSSDLIFWPHRDMADEEIVDELMLRQNLYLAGGERAVAEHHTALALEVMQDPHAKPYSREWAAGVQNGKNQSN